MVPDYLPVLARGKHRNARRGACFMEFASLLAGERWSDHPPCTHPVLAVVARCVNDATTDAGRPLLAPLVPQVIGTAGTDPRVGPALALEASRTALEHVCGQARFLLAIGLVSAERMLADAERGMTPTSSPSPRSDPSADLLTEDERSAAEAYVAEFRVSPRYYRTKGAASAIGNAVSCLAERSGPETDVVLREMLRRSVVRYHELMDGPDAVDVDDTSWEAACAVVGVAGSP